MFYSRYIYLIGYWAFFALLWGCVCYYFSELDIISLIKSGQIFDLLIHEWLPQSSFAFYILAVNKSYGYIRKIHPVKWVLDILYVYRNSEAKWATLKDIRRMKPNMLAEKGIVLGRFDGDFNSSHLLAVNSPCAAVVVGPTGIGKSAGIVMPTILNSDDATLIISEAHGTLYSQTSKYREKLGPIFHLNWCDADQIFNSWNPIALENLPENTQDVEFYVDKLCAIFWCRNYNSVGISYMSDVFSSIILYYILLCKSEGRSTTIVEVLDWARHSQWEHRLGKFQLAADIAKERQYPSRIRMHLLRIASFSRLERMNFFTCVSLSFSAFEKTGVSCVTSSSDFSLKNIREIDGKPVTIYIKNPLFGSDDVGKLTVFFFEALFQVLTSGEVQSERKRPIRALIDDASLLPDVSNLLLSSNMFQSLNLSMLMVSQGYYQFEKTWGKNYFDHLVSHLTHQVIFSQALIEPCELISQKIGTYKRQRKTVTKYEDINNHPTVVKWFEDDPLIHPSRLCSLGGDHIILVSSAMNRPIYARTLSYFKDKNFKHLLS
ncbi:MAG: type IV secretory system conjugative DNA transfer family protein [Alphaproteobacteria bacterium]|nr:type IV secretory system conjugative DNA transfer family protein [Alphaproteobacteria bacterium]MBP9877869.1 type IV secretory system conjugative DNA transfer family protein [Alphaproteobacteria bacterium]